MSRKSLARFRIVGIIVGLLAMSVAPAMANHIDTATATVTCTGYTLQVTGGDLGQPGNVTYTITLTPTSGSSITVSGQLAVSPNDSAGDFSGSATGNIAPPPGDYTLTGSATLFLSDGTEENTVSIDFPSSTLSCPGPTSQVCVAQSTNSSNFNGTPIDQGSTIWFNANFTAKGIPSTGATVSFTGSTIQITTDTGSQTLTVPDAQITFSSSAPCASTSFDTNTQTWMTIVPVSGSDEIFLSGLAFLAPGGLPGGIQNVTWQGNFSTDTPGLTIQWKWGAAVYSAFTDYNSLAVKPTHQSACGLNNGDHAGTPENPMVKSEVIGGATGGGGSNWTGSWSGTQSVTPVCP